MSRISYTALREFERTNVITSTGISAAPADDSFNIASGFPALLDDEWIEVSGFANAANNGWFQLKGTATGAKIIQVTPALSHLRLPGLTGNNATTPDTVANSVLGDIDVRVKVSLTDWSPTSETYIFQKGDGSSNRSWVFGVGVGGNLISYFSQSGSAWIDGAPGHPSTVVPGITDGATKWLRMTRVSGTGVITYYTSDDGVTWTPLGATVASTTGNLFNSTGTLGIWALTTTGMAGRCYYAELRSGVAGSVVAAFDPTRGSRTSLSFVALTGETWTIFQSGGTPAQLQGRELVTEAAGPAVTIQGYKRGLGQLYDLEFYSERVDRSVQVKRSSRQPMGGGSPEILLHRREAYIDVSVIGPLGEPLTEAQLLQWSEFMASVEGGETFTLDRYGTVAAPVETLTVQLASEMYTEERVASMRRYKLAFQVRVL